MNVRERIDPLMMGIGRKRSQWAAILAAGMMLLLLFGCREASLRSEWKNSEIVVDGLYRDWTDDSLPYFEKQSMFVGFRNDAEYLYIMIRTVDRRAQMKVMRLGLTVWIEPSEDSGEAWGVHYPLGLEDHGIPVFGGGVPGEPDSTLNARIEEMLDAMELVGPGENRKVDTVPGVPEGNDYGIRAAVRDTSGVIVYELRIPLQTTDTRRYAVGAAPGERFRVRFETGDARPDLRERDINDERYDPNRDTSTGKVMNKGRDREREREDRRRRMEQRMASFNPMVEPISLKAEITLASDSSSGGR